MTSKKLISNLENFKNEKEAMVMNSNIGNNFRKGFRKEEIIMKNEKIIMENNNRNNGTRMEENNMTNKEYLNKAQLDAVKNTEGFVRVIAGAGSGKTRALTCRYAGLVKDLGISPKNILCITFTNKAAKEMQDRIEKTVGNSDLRFICTFHKFCIQLLREEYKRVKLPSDFVVLDEDDSERIIRKIINNNKFETISVSGAKELLRKWKNLVTDNGRTYLNILLEQNTTEIYNSYINSNNEDIKLFAGYMYEQKKCQGLDFDDLLKLTVYILTTYEDVRQKWQKKFKYIMVDEFQDVNDSQYEICKILSGFHKNLFVVGDPDQNIYSWRGANVKYINNFDKDFPECKTILMNENYRSDGNIIKVSNSLINKNKNRIEKNLIPVKEDGDSVVYYKAKSPEEQSKWISEQILELKNRGVNLNDIAVLFRTNYMSQKIEESFVANKIDYTVYKGITFYNQRAIKDALSYLKMIAKDDDMSFLRTVTNNDTEFGVEEIDLVETYARKNDCSLYEALKANIKHELISKTKSKEYVDMIEKHRGTYHEKTVSQVLSEILDESGYGEKVWRDAGINTIESLNVLIQSITDIERTKDGKLDLDEYLKNIEIYTEVEPRGKDSGVKIMTIHTAKGLEFPYVFVCSMNEGDFPTRRIMTEEEMEEERRLAYVAFTRAEKGLYLSSSGGFDFCDCEKEPSRFISDVDKGLLKNIG